MPRSRTPSTTSIAPGQPFAGQGHAPASRYAGDATPEEDTNGDGHTLNGDVGTHFTTWGLRCFDWQLSDEDGSAIPSSVYDAPGWDPLQEMLPGGFDAPRTWNRADPWWQLWQRFRETMLWRHNTEFAKWITTSVDPETNATVPATRWFSYQIPADYLFGATPEHPNLRVDTSASAWWTADIAPYGSLGITAFNGYLGNGWFVPTLSNVAPLIAARNRRFGILEWHPSVPPAPDDSPIWDEEMAIIEQYRPAVIAPFALDAGESRVALYDTGFETALRRLVDRIKDGPATVSRGRLGAGPGGGERIRR